MRPIILRALNRAAIGVKRLNKEKTIVGKVNRLLAPDANLVAHDHDPASLVNDLTGQINNLTGQVNGLTGQVNDLTGQVNHLTSQVNHLTSQVNHLTGQINELTGQVNDLSSQRDVLLGGVGLPSVASATLMRPYARAVAAYPIPLAIKKPRRAKFLIIGNMRTGSTWLETLLGALPDVVTEYELKWRPRFAPLAVHRVLDMDSPTVDQILEEFESDLPVAGSKLILDLDYLSPIEFSGLEAKLGPGIRIIHLTRDLRSIFLSRHRGLYHRLNRDSTVRVSERLRAAIDEADVARAKAQHPRERVHNSDCYDELAIYVRNDARVAQLTGPSGRYLHIDYGEIPKRLTEIARFVGSEAGLDVIRGVLENSPTVKLPPVEPEQLVKNVDELTPLFEHFEALRKRCVDHAAVRGEILEQGFDRFESRGIPIIAT
jgi:hypothetical protein